MALGSQGSRIAHSPAGSPAVYVDLEEVTSIGGPDGTLNLIDVSHLKSLRKEYLPGLADNGTISVECNFIAGTEQMLLFDMFNTSAVAEQFRIQIPTDPTWTQFHGFLFDGIISKWTLGETVDDKSKLSITIQTTGGVTYDAP
jgi:hypothetical protein